MSGPVGERISNVLRPLQGQQVTLRDVAVRRGVTHQTVSRQARSGQLPGAFRSGPSWRVHADAAEAWLNGWWCPNREPWTSFADRHGLTETRCL